MLTCNTETSIVQALDHFSFSAKPAEILNEILDFIEMKGVSFLKKVPTRWQSLMLRKDAKMLTWCKITPQIFEV